MEFREVLNSASYAIGVPLPTPGGIGLAVILLVDEACTSHVASEVDQRIPSVCWAELQEAGAGQQPARRPFLGTWYLRLGKLLCVGVLGVGLVQLEAQGEGPCPCLELIQHCLRKV